MEEKAHIRDDFAVPLAGRHFWVHAGSGVEVGGAASHADGLRLGQLGRLLGHHLHSLGTPVHHAIAVLLRHALLLLLLLLHHLVSRLGVHAPIHHALH